VGGSDEGKGGEAEFRLASVILTHREQSLMIKI